MSDIDQRVLEIARNLDGQTGEATRESVAVAETLGAALAAALRPFTPDTVIVWCDPLTTVLGHVVARELGANLLHAQADEGILWLSQPPHPDARIALIDYAWAPFPGLIPLLRMTKSAATVAVVGSVLSLPAALTGQALGGTATVSLSGGVTRTELETALDGS
jgi:hypothetical protein